MTILDALESEDNNVGKIYGVALGVVTNNQDEDKLGRVKLWLPFLSDDNETDWVRIATFMSGNEKGGFFLPEVKDEVLVAFAHGDINSPYVIGSLWNEKGKKPPETNSDGKNNFRFIKSRSGHIIKFDDTDGKEKIEIVDKSNNNSIIIDTSMDMITIKSNKDIKISAPNGKISIDANEIEIKSSTSAKIEASAEMTIKGATVNIN
ncbi:MAG: phage baseplate assembly protein V [Candidatus Methanoperedens sp.]|nr:phage baseplate assembly protein V [Candidatus Methanoperedens sp.]CAG0963666.1 Actin cross-linking toxin VgrG1 [Methanosarcinales archaeon]